jgi:hypothetical protein
MVVPSLTVGAFVGILLSGGYLYFEVGRFATPQVPETLFDERREIFAYTAGLFVGVPFAIAYVLYVTSLSNGALPGTAISLAALVGGMEVAEWWLARSRYWGRTESFPFYALAFRAAVGGIIGLAAIAQYLGGASITASGVALALLQAGAILGLEVTGALLSIRRRPDSLRTSGGPLSGAIFGVFGFFLIGVGLLAGTVGAFAGAALALIGSVVVYRGLRPTLASIPPPTAGPKAPTPLKSGAYGRTRGGSP